MPSNSYRRFSPGANRAAMAVAGVCAHPCADIGKATTAANNTSFEQLSQHLSRRMFDINSFLGNVDIEGGNKSLAFRFCFRLILDAVQTASRNNDYWRADQRHIAPHLSAHIIRDFKMRHPCRIVLDSIVQIEQNPRRASEFPSMLKPPHKSLFRAIQSPVVAGIRIQERGSEANVNLIFLLPDGRRRRGIAKRNQPRNSYAWNDPEFRDITIEPLHVVGRDIFV